LATRLNREAKRFGYNTERRNYRTKMAFKTIDHTASVTMTLVNVHTIVLESCFRWGSYSFILSLIEALIS